MDHSITGRSKANSNRGILSTQSFQTASELQQAAFDQHMYFFSKFFFRDENTWSSIKAFSLKFVEVCWMQHGVNLWQVGCGFLVDFQVTCSLYSPKCCVNDKNKRIMSAYQLWLQQLVCYTWKIDNPFGAHSCQEMHNHNNVHISLEKMAHHGHLLVWLGSSHTSYPSSSKYQLLFWYHVYRIDGCPPLVPPLVVKSSFGWILQDMDCGFTNSLCIVTIIDLLPIIPIRSSKLKREAQP